MRLLAAIDGGPGSAAVLGSATRLAALIGADVDVVHAGHEHDGAAADAAALAGLPVRLLDGPVAAALRSAAEADGVAGTVVGTGSPGAADPPAGHVATALMNTCARPLVLVPDGADRARLRRVLAPLDGSPDAAETVARLREAFAGADLLPLHIITPAAVPPYADQAHHWSAAYAREFRARNALGDGAGLLLRTGEAATRVLDAAAELDADLIALTWHQHLAPGRAAVVRSVLADGELPVLLIPAGDGAGDGDGDAGD